MSPSLSFFETTCKIIGFDPAVDVGIFNPMPDEPMAKKTAKPLFESDEEDNILFNIMDIHGNIRTQDVSEAKSKVSIKPIQLIRFKEPGDRPKYLPLRNGQGTWPWISIEVVKAFKEKKKVKRLVLTEGYKKAFVACKKGVITIGLPGITVWKQKEAKEIFADINLFCKTCQVEDILWITDSDTFHIHWEPGKDLYKRPASFYNSVMLFKSLCRDLETNLFYGVIKDTSKSKGLDDLFIDHPKATEQIVKDLTRTSGDPKYIQRFNIGTWTFAKIQELFGINKDPFNFYQKYEQYIGLEEFVYKNGVYQFDPDANELLYNMAGESSQFIRVMRDYYMKAVMPAAHTFSKNTLITTDKNSIIEKFKSRSKKEIERIIFDIPFFDAFYNDPEHINYKYSMELEDENGHRTKWYNKYSKISHKPVLGRKIDESEIPISIRFIKHIFGINKVPHNGGSIDEWELGLDYLQLLYTKPKQQLPVLSLISAENQTGKSKFWDWCVAIFQQNAKKIPPEMLTGNFTEYFMNSLLVVIDEALFNKRETMERVKAMTTSDEAMVNGKHAKEIEIQTYLKIGLSSNNVNDFAILSKDDQRFWIRDVPPIPEEDYMPDFFTKICDEIPLFLGYLMQREMATENEDRMWFHPSLRKTEGLLRVIDKSRPANEILIEETIRDYMTAMDKPFVHLSQKDIKNLSGEEKTLQLNTIRWVIEDRWRIQKLGHCRKYPFYTKNIDTTRDGTDTVEESWHSTNYYTFSANRFFKPTEILILFSKEEIIDAEMKYAYELKHLITADEYFEIKYTGKTPPCEFKYFKAIYDGSKSIGELHEKLGEYLLNGNMPF